MATVTVSVRVPTWILSKGRVEIAESARTIAAASTVPGVHIALIGMLPVLWQAAASLIARHLFPAGLLRVMARRR